MSETHHTDHPSDAEQAAVDMYQRVESAIDKLTRLSRKDEDRAHFETFLEDLAYEALSDDEEFSQNALQMKSGRLSNEEQVRIRNRQRQLVTDYKDSILREAGIDTQLAKSELENAKEKVKELTETIVKNNGAATPTTVLSELGILVDDADGRQVFTYPASLFPKTTNDKWATYLENVRLHLRKERELHAGTASQSELEEADKARRFAHNAVTRDVHEILGLDWQFEETRNLLAKMRDSRFPTVATGEAHRTGRAVAEGAIGAKAVEILLTKLSDLHE